MKKRALTVTLLIFFAFSTALFAASFRVYPGAKLEHVYETKQPETASKMSKGPKVIVFTTNDFFENVVAFYRGAGREYRMPGTGERPMRLSTGQELREAYFIFDNAADLSTSKHWIKIQRPYLVRGPSGEGPRGKFEKIRDITAIIEEDKRDYR